MYMTPQACAAAGAEYPDYKLFVGFDVGKTFRVAHARDHAGRRVCSGRVDNVEAAIDAFLACAIGLTGVGDPALVLVWSSWTSAATSGQQQGKC